MSSFIKKYIKFHESNDLKIEISNINWHREKHRIESYLKFLIGSNGLDKEFYVDHAYDGYQSNSYKNTPGKGYIQNKTEKFGHETIGIYQYKKPTGITDIIKNDNNTEFSYHWDYGIRFQFINSAYGNTIFLVSRPKCDDSAIEYPDLLLGFSRNCAYLTNSNLNSVFEKALFYEMYTAFGCRKTILQSLKFQYLYFKSSALRQGLKKSISVSGYDLIMLFLTIFGIYIGYLTLH